MDKLFWYTLGKKRGGGGVETEDLTVPLNMADGNQIITPSEGKLLSGVTIEKPETLIPENIAEGVDIGGIIGALAAGGGGAKVAVGTASSQYGTITHNLGVVPDIMIMVINKTQDVRTSDTGLYAFGISSAMKAKYPAIPGNANATRTSSSISTAYAGDETIERTGVITYGFYEATETTVKYAHANAPMPTSSSKTWIAIAGLT